jgi:4-hydroxybenzoate polyprenyltransferase
MNLSDILEEIRPKQWYKQGIVMIPLLFSRNLTNIESIISVLLAVVSFSAVASSVYIINDIADREEDRKHPEKKHRPIASRRISAFQGLILSLVLFLFGTSLSYTLGFLFLAVITTYVIQNLFYSFYLKQVAIIDVLLISFGFVLRASGGAVAIGEPVSPWLVINIGLLALLLGIGKRHDELKGINGNETRKVLEVYDDIGTERLLNIIVSTQLTTYAIYTFTYELSLMVITFPFVLFALFRYLYLIEHIDIGSKPYLLFRDKPLVVNTFLWSLTVFVVLYRSKYIIAIVEYV